MVGKTLRRWIRSPVGMWEWRISYRRVRLMLLRHWRWVKAGVTLLRLFVYVIVERRGSPVLEESATIRGVLLLDI